jgi:hypothetical protein
LHRRAVGLETNRGLHAGDVHLDVVVQEVAVMGEIVTVLGFGAPRVHVEVL